MLRHARRGATRLGLDHMMRLFTWYFLLLVLLPASMLSATERERIGRGWLATNDVIGDTHDRWQTGSFASSRVWGPAWAGRLPERFGDVIELRFGGQISSPQNLTNPGPGDRPFAGALSLGLHTHFARGLMDYAVGVDLVFTGPQTGLDDFQVFLHDVLGGRRISSGVRNNQVSNDVNPTLVAEMGRDVSLGGNTRVRPFAEARWGFETLARVGFDLTIGGRGNGGLQMREAVTGQRYEAIQSAETGVSFVLGADVAYVDDSEILNRDRGIQLTDTRNRVRAGVNWQGQRGSSLYYGLTWLDEEFEAQAESQIVGSVQLRLKF